MNQLLNNVSALPSAIRIAIGNNVEQYLSREWLIGNRIGAYCSSTVVGCNTRRYHGLLTAATRPPVGRIVALSSLVDSVTVQSQSGSETFDLAVNEFDGAFSPCGIDSLVEFRNDTAATFVYSCGPARIVKEILPAEAANAVAVRYTVTGSHVTLRIRPLVALRDFHHIRQGDQTHQLTFEQTAESLVIQDLSPPGHNVHILAEGAAFNPQGQWWYGFKYRTDQARGQNGLEDIYSPGEFEVHIEEGDSFQLTASLDEPVAMDFKAALAARKARCEELVRALPGEADETARRLAVACDSFVVKRDLSARGIKSSATILAGFHWFADWGRDAFIALPGLLLCTGRFELAKEVFRTFADQLSEGMIPCRFDDYSSGPHYNNIDASLWFIIASERYLQATGDVAFWRNTLMPAANAILTGYHDGTRFAIHADADGLLMGGSEDTQLTWMDARIDDQSVTPRHGKAVEINALWHSAHVIMANRCKGLDDSIAEQYGASAELIATAFNKAFWNQDTRCLYDCVGNSGTDGSIRPNQILAVSLPHSPLEPDRQRAVLECVRNHLLTPMGLRTLSPFDPRYRRRYGESWKSRDKAYHQGTVWAWLIGPFIEAHLKVEGQRLLAVAQARQWLEPFDKHLNQAGLGTVSEIFDGDEPHDPRGCICQAWSVAEILRAKLLVEQYAKGSDH